GNVSIRNCRVGKVQLKSIASALVAITAMSAHGIRRPRVASQLWRLEHGEELMNGLVRGLNASVRPRFGGFVQLTLAGLKGFSSARTSIRFLIGIVAVMVPICLFVLNSTRSNRQRQFAHERRRQRLPSWNRH